jgi:di/tricarboxylate transporter
MATLGRRFIPNRFPDDDGDAQERDIYFTEIRIPTLSRLIGKTIDESGLIDRLQLAMLTLQRGEQTQKALADTVLQANDILLVEGTKQAMLALQDFDGINVSGEIQQLEDYVRLGKSRIAEVIIMPNSPLIGRTVKGIGLRDRYQLQILAVNQAGAIRRTKIGRLTFGVGDVLLIKLPQRNLPLLEQERNFRVLDMIEQKVIDIGRVRRASLIFGGVMMLAVLGILPIAVATMLGATLAFITRSITPEIAYRHIEWKLLILIGSMLAFGQAMQSSGSADFLAQMLVQLPFADNPIVLLGLFFVLAVILTQPMSNQAAAAVLLPIAIQTALLMGFNPRPFAIMIAIAATTSFITPLEPACLLIYGAGRYRFMDFVRVGGLLSLLVFVVAMVLVPLLWHF